MLFIRNKLRWATNFSRARLSKCSETWTSYPSPTRPRKLFDPCQAETSLALRPLHPTNFASDLRSPPKLTTIPIPDITIIHTPETTTGSLAKDIATSLPPTTVSCEFSVPLTCTQVIRVRSPSESDGEYAPPLKRRNFPKTDAITNEQQILVTCYSKRCSECKMSDFKTQKLTSESLQILSPLF